MSLLSLLNLTKIRRNFFKLFQAKILLPYPLKTLENLWFPVVFSWYRSNTLGWNWLKRNLNDYSIGFSNNEMKVGSANLITCNLERIFTVKGIEINWAKKGLMKYVLHKSHFELLSCTLIRPTREIYLWHISVKYLWWNFFVKIVNS